MNSTFPVGQVWNTGQPDSSWHWEEWVLCTGGGRKVGDDIGSYRLIRRKTRWVFLVQAKTNRKLIRQILTFHDLSPMYTQAIH